MSWLHDLSYFFGGAFLANAVPHFVSGTLGRPFQSPFAKPAGEGLSSSTVNVLWGFAQLRRRLPAYRPRRQLRSARRRIRSLPLARAFCSWVSCPRGCSGGFNGGNSPMGS